MISNHLKLALAIACATFSLLLASCGGSATTSYYLLTSTEKQAMPVQGREHTDNIAIDIASIRLPSHLDRQHVVVHNSENEIVPSLFHQWGGRLEQNIAHVIAMNLTHLLSNVTISMPPHKTPVHPDYRLEIEIFRFERLQDNTVQLTARWKLLNRNADTILVNRMFELSGKQTTHGDMDQVIASMSSLIGKLSQQIAESITKQSGTEEKPDA